MGTTSPPAPPARDGVRGALAGLAVCALLLGALWWLDLFVLHTRVLTSFRGHPPLTPLYAFWHPQFRRSRSSPAC
jgi:hypothetical protein